MGTVRVPHSVLSAVLELLLHGSFGKHTDVIVDRPVLQLINLGADERFDAGPIVIGVLRGQTFGDLSNDLIRVEISCHGCTIRGES